ncbi:hypothetical protein K3N28_19590 [Glycomyces sp. TRM65418]|uniref:hypothetical protein n=1 Tax=Glycomyces sp. TRM65418 TaxID=2867006 RepID=UPI001CE52617|nr:hypothetical protein [Glycomyces sp. TRM65418]MCC3765266.1 hypothetical protein [Glycomyces sp. TRM65418]QZD54887.1 hypothetical protein K3N28_19495 [Glycomyces sp. TRM65418]
MTGFFVILILAAVIVGAWKIYASQKSPAAAYAPAAPAFVPPTPLYEVATVRLDLPSVVPAFRFNCEFSVRYRTDNAVSSGPDPLTAVKSAIQAEARTITAAYALDGDMGLLEYELDVAFQAGMTDGGRPVDFSAQCLAIACDSAEQKLVKEVSLRKFRLEVENHLEEAYRTRIRQLDEFFSEPRSAALWWFAQNPDKIDQLPNKIKLMYKVDRSLHHEGAEGGVSWFDPEHPDGLQAADLSDFLATSDLSSRAAVGTLLGNTYERFGRADLAQRARMLAEAPEPEPERDPEPEPESQPAPDTWPVADAEGSEPERE